MDAIEYDFLTGERAALTAFAEQSDILDVQALDPRVFLLGFNCQGLIETSPGSVVEHEGFLVSVYLHEGYLRRVIPPLVLSLREPRTCWSPSIKAPLMCIGPIAPGTGLVELATRAYELISYQTYGVSEHDALRPEACPFVRANLERFPVDGRPLKWRREAAA